MTNQRTRLPIRRFAAFSARGSASALLLWSGASHASPEYTDALQNALGMECPPRCTLCHQSNEGGLGTVRPRSFGEVAVAVADLQPEDVDGLLCALRLLDPACDDEALPACAAEGQSCLAADTDADGTADVDELRIGSDPNVPGEGVLCSAAFGCSATIAPPLGHASSGLAGWVLGGLVASLSMAARRAAKRREDVRRR